ncbi:putative ABC transporter permease [Bifidobacterium choloepi]|uniref:Putative ABC transporter permease n=1 Tax=Bifidobacterium choloepi TaxID=2614131 RepID=A0A6I5MZ03_9BIFI|nr:putative ABC transporter permease [Bifidobacterium choloepi]NEG69868.1 putative ABC transporter permease [Bifidobacterium choloepi]
MSEDRQARAPKEPQREKDAAGKTAVTQAVTNAVAAGQAAAATATKTVKQDVADLEADRRRHRKLDKEWHDEEEEVDASQHKLNVFVRILGGVIAICGLAALPFLAMQIMQFTQQVTDGSVGVEVKSLTFLLEAIHIVVQIVTALAMVVFGFLLIVGKRRYAMYWAYVLIPLVIAKGLLVVCLHGLDYHLILPFVQLVVLVVLSVTVDPQLRRERQVQHQLRQMDRHAEYEKAKAENMAGRDLTGKGYVSLNFFNIFWMFVVASVVGLILETIFHLIVFGAYQDRAGMLWGPFSPIYGFGAVLMTVFLNRLYKSNWFLIFCASAVIGGAFEYFTSWFMQTAFGITAWNYSNEWGNIDGRTSVAFMCCWGLLGLAWLKIILPPLLKLIQKIPWKVRYWLTIVCFVLLLFDGVMTLLALDAWYSRLADISQNTPVAEFFARYFDNSFMANRFQTMSLNPKSAGRL